MKKKFRFRALLFLAFVIVIITIKPYVWHSFQDNYSITGVVKKVEIVATRYQQTIYMNFKTTDGKVYNFRYNNDPSPWVEAESFYNLTKLSEGDEVELSIYSVGYYLVSSEKANVSLYVKDVKWLT